MPVEYFITSRPARLFVETFVAVWLYTYTSDDFVDLIYYQIIDF